MKKNLMEISSLLLVLYSVIIISGCKPILKPSKGDDLFESAFTAVDKIS